MKRRAVQVNISDYPQVPSFTLPDQNGELK